ncbi:cobalt-precorrin 5A hydrolase [Actinocorallia herbida]|uniref:Cobalt-precorrin 5A hydrolase n=1 Tax=Actinocorallia herbida TaxID=58109 RepID=A0A3N1D7P3_9ACTN|nr:cobalamin biosynthesis protein [Actinocorallia herbida]ROO89535.1 cobalt-precorrin 5A hydrolase [Actinocorallia herbida]
MTQLTSAQGGPAYVLGVGARKGVSAEEVEGLVRRVLAEAGVPPDQVTALATVTAKADEPGILAVARAHGWNVMIFPPDTLAAMQGTDRSELARRATGTPSVAEAAALAGAASPHGTPQLIGTAPSGGAEAPAGTAASAGAPRSGGDPAHGSGRAASSGGTAASGGGGLAVPKRRSARATVALARVREESG